MASFEYSALAGWQMNETKMPYFFKLMNSPLGVLKLVASNIGLAGVLWENDDPSRVRFVSLTQDDKHALLCETERQLNDYFEGRRRQFSVKLDFGGTAFQKEVWDALLAIPFSETRTYQQIAECIRRPRAVRAVGAAIGRNPISIIAPCHRVIGANGKLTGFAGGLDAKDFLLSLESGRLQARKARS